MPAPVARSRALVGAGVLAGATAGSLLLSVGTSSSATAPAVRPFHGPVAVAAPAQPLVRTDGPLLPSEVPVRVAARPFVGPSAVPARTAGPVPVVGPGSPLRHVREVQRRLNARGASLRVDGAWGPATAAAVVRLQERSGLPVDGRVGPLTVTLLQR